MADTLHEWKVNFGTEQSKQKTLLLLLLLTLNWRCRTARQTYACKYT